MQHGTQLILKYVRIGQYRTLKLNVVLDLSGIYHLFYGDTSTTSSPSSYVT